jgi:hypothetical protein
MSLSEVGEEGAEGCWIGCHLGLMGDCSKSPMTHASISKNQLCDGEKRGSGEVEEAWEEEQSNCLRSQTQK